MPIFAEPIALLGLTALVPLTVLYLLFRRPRPREVSSLLLWEGLAQSRTSGSRLDRLRTPLSYFLECLCVALLALAAATPLLLLGTSRRPLVVVFDNSLSMMARGVDGKRAYERALEELTQILRDEKAVRYVLAGQRPRALPDVESGAIATALLPWTRNEPAADLDAACALARDLGGPRARILVLTDRAPPSDVLPPEVRWLGLGQRAENVGFVNAVRDEASILLDVKNFGKVSASRAVRISLNPLPVAEGDEPRDDPTLIHTEQLKLEPGESRRVRFAVKAPGRVISAEIDPDGLEFDDGVTLAPVDRPLLRASVRVVNESLASALERAIVASGVARLDATDPQIEFTDGPATPTEEFWIVQFQAVGDAADVRLITAPFVIDQTHPVGDGLDLEGVIWSAPRTVRGTQSGDVPIVVSASGEIIVERFEEGGQGRSLILSLDPARSNLTAHPSWPVLIWNALTWRDSTRSGPSRANVPIGQLAQVRFAGEEARVIQPNGESVLLRVSDGVASLDASMPGLHRVESEEEHFSFSVLPIAAAESDLAAAVTSEHGAWSNPEEGQRDVRSIAWIAALVALGVLLFHARLLAPSKEGAP